MIEETQPGSRAEGVLRVFQKVDPSAVGIEDPTLWREYSSKLMCRFVNEYKLPIRIFQGASVLDVGCGTGEKSLVFASWGAKVTGVDYNEKALARARYLASISRFSTGLIFYQSSLPELPELIQDQEFDICHVDGVLHHVLDPVAALNTIAAKVVAGGWLVIRNYQSITSFQRLLKRMIVRLGACEAEEMIVANTKRLFYEDVQRSVALGGRAEDQAIYDNFVNPQYTPFDHQTILQLCQAQGFRVYALSPTVEAPAFLGPGSLTHLVHEATDEIAKQWWAVSLARAMIATEPASAFLEHVHEPLGSCSESCVALEGFLRGFLDNPTGESWDRVVEGVFHYLSACQDVLTSLYQVNEIQIRKFLEELRQIQMLVKDCIEQRAPVEALPETSVLFRKMSGFPMTSWILWKPESTPPTPFRLPENELGDRV